MNESSEELAACLELSRRELASRFDFSYLTEAVVHEFNNFLNTMVLQLEILKRSHLGEEPQSRVAAVQQQFQQLGALLKQMQQYIDSRSVPWRTVDVNALLRQVVNDQEGGAGQPWAGRVDPALQAEEIVLSTSRFTLTRLLQMLLEHAVAVTPAGQRVTVRTQRLDNGCRIVVEDQGPAVAPEMLGKLFEPFATSRLNGDGSTLAICKMLARRLQGSLRAETRSGAGMTFTLELKPIRDRK